MNISTEQILRNHTVKKTRVRTNRSKAQWEQLVQEYQESELSQSAFCKAHEIPCSSFLKWRKYFTAQTSRDFVEITEPLNRTPLQKTTTEQPNHWQVELELGAGVILRVRAG